MPHGEQTLAIIKPDAYELHAVGNIISMIEEQGIQIRALTMLRLTADQAHAFYAVHTGKPFFEPLVAFMSSGPCLPMVLEGDNVVQEWRLLMGPTDPAKAPENTIRRRYGTNVRLNAVHGSDSAENAALEINFFFGEHGVAVQGSFRKESSI